VRRQKIENIHLSLLKGVSRRGTHVFLPQGKFESMAMESASKSADSKSVLEHFSLGLGSKTISLLGKQVYFSGGLRVAPTTRTPGRRPARTCRVPAACARAGAATGARAPGMRCMRAPMPTGILASTPTETLAATPTGTRASTTRSSRCRTLAPSSGLAGRGRAGRASKGGTRTKTKEDDNGAR
jgi:hypothetical protein